MKRYFGFQTGVKLVFSATMWTLILMGVVSAHADNSGAALSAAVENSERTAAFGLRDSARHPVQTLAFFDVQPQHHVVEIWPGSGWYTEILAPYLMTQGRLYAAHFPVHSSVSYFNKSRAKYADKLAANPDTYRGVEITAFYPPASESIAPTASADRVLTFRNVHNWLKAGYAPAAFTEFYRALKPGGVLGVVEHRAPVGTSIEDMISSGYMTEAKVIALAEAAGFKVLASSEINANPRDNALHPAGVWSLPPSLRLGERDREKYVTIGESDRMTLAFIKPDLPARE